MVNVVLRGTWQGLPFQRLNHRVVDAALSEPRRKRVTKIMEVEIMHPCPFAGPRPIVLERIAILPLAEESSADSWHSSNEGLTGEAVERNDLWDPFDLRAPG
jgi:hypothetical protein